MYSFKSREISQSNFDCDLDETNLMDVYLFKHEPFVQTQTCLLMSVNICLM